jgi:uncharacterized membrane protein YcjF (UPF0283 family)
MADTTITPSGDVIENPKKSRWPLKRVVMVAAGALGGVILIIFVIGVLLALFGDNTWPGRIQIIRDIFIIAMTLEVILIIAALAILILQVARLINLLQNDIKPILQNTRETLNSAKGTVDFVGSNVTEPIIRTSSFLAGAGVFIREVGGIRRAIRPSKKERSHE